MKNIAMNLLDKAGYKLVKKEEINEKFPDIQESEFWDIYKQCQPYTMTSVERMYGLYKAVEYILSNDIKGAFVECGVWRGGSAMIIAQMLTNRKIKNRKLYLYDTFEGMSVPTKNDVSFVGRIAQTEIAKKGYNKNGNSTWCLADLLDVKKNLNQTNYIPKNIIYIKGKVEDTIPSKMPEEEIALLRLDTDWYESTKHELNFLFPKLVKKGIIIIDDYGHWKGCRKAVDEYFSKNPEILFNRLDYTGRIGLKYN